MKEIPVEEIFVALSESIDKLKEEGVLTLNLEWEGRRRKIKIKKEDKFEEIVKKVRKAFKKNKKKKKKIWQYFSKN